MLRSLRTRLALLFAGMLLIAAVIAAAASIRLYQSYNRAQTAKELRGQVVGVADYYASATKAFTRGGQQPAPVTADQFNTATGAHVYYQGPRLFPSSAKGPPPLTAAGIRHLPFRWTTLGRGVTKVIKFTPRGDPRTFIGAAAPVVLGNQAIGVVFLAKPLNDVNNAWRGVAARLALGTGVGLLVAFILATFVARRITKPLKVVGEAADRVARGDLEVNVVTARTPDDELGTLAKRFQGMVDRLRELDELERNFLMRVTHELRTPITAISGHVQAVTEGVVDPEDLDASLGAVSEEVRRIGRLVDDLLDLTRLEAHQFRLLREEVGLEALLEQAAGSFREKARNN